MFAELESQGYRCGKSRATWAAYWWRGDSHLEIDMKPFLPVTRPSIDAESIAAVADVLRSGQLASGPKVQASRPPRPPMWAPAATCAS